MMQHGNALRATILHRSNKLASNHLGLFQSFSSSPATSRNLLRTSSAIPRRTNLVDVIRMLSKTDRSFSTTTNADGLSNMEKPVANPTGAGIGNVRNQVLPSSQEECQNLFRLTKQPRTASIIGVPMTFGQPYVGTDSGTKLLRQAGLRSQLSSLGWRVEDLPEINCDAHLSKKPSQQEQEAEKSMPPYRGGNAKNSWLVGSIAQELADLVHDKLQAGRFPLVVGGDHSIGLGSLAGVLRAKPNTGVIWVDAHADLNTPQSSTSGNMHGMPVGMMMEGIMKQEDYPPGCRWVYENSGAGKSNNRLSPDSIVYVGLRDVDGPEREFIREFNIKAYTMHDIDRYGIGRVMDMALEHLLEKDVNRPLHLSYDIDAIDPVLAPATGTTVRGGLTFREAHYVAEAVAGSGNLASAEIVELNPTLSDGKGAEATVELGLHIVTSMMGNGII